MSLQCGNSVLGILSRVSLMIDQLTRVLPVLRGLGPVYLLLALLPGVAAAQGTGTRYLNPKGLVKPTGYTHVVVAPDARTVYIRRPSGLRQCREGRRGG